MKKKDLVVIFIGSNDLFAAILAPAGAVDVPAALGQSVANILQTIYMLNANGAENFMIFEAANVARTPVLNAQVAAGDLPPEALAVAKNLTGTFNQKLFKNISALRSNRDFSGNVWYFPTFATAEFIASPLGGWVTGLKSTTPCSPELGLGQSCSTSTFWDFVHVSSAVHRIFADVAEVMLYLPPLVRR